MADFTEDIKSKGTDFTNEPPPFHGIITPEIAAKLYSTYVAEPLTKKLASTVAPALGFLPGATTPRPSDTSQEPPGMVARGLAGMVVPQDLTLAILGLAAPGMGKIAEGLPAATRIGGLRGPMEQFIARRGPIGKAVLGGGIRTALTTAGGAGISSVTGDSPMKGAEEGLSVGIAGEAFRNIRNIFRHLSERDILHVTPEGFTRSRERFAPPVSAGRGGWVAALVQDNPALSGFVDSYSDLQGLVSLISGNKITRNSPLAQEIGTRIYAPFRAALSALPPDKISFPYLKEMRLPANQFKIGPGRFPFVRPDRQLYNEPTIADVLPKFYHRILQGAYKLPPNLALTVIQQLKKKAYTSTDEVVRAAADKFATRMEKDFVAYLRNHNPALVSQYQEVLGQYARLKGLQLIVSKHQQQLFPRTAQGPGLNPASWADILATPEGSIFMPEDQFPAFHSQVSFGIPFRGAGAIQEEPAGGSIRAYSPFRVFHVSLPIAKHPSHISIPAAVQRAPIGPLTYPRALGVAGVSGVEAALNQQREVEQESE